MKRKFLAVLITLCMVLTLPPVEAHADVAISKDITLTNRDTIEEVQEWFGGVSACEVTGVDNVTYLGGTLLTAYEHYTVKLKDNLNFGSSYISLNGSVGTIKLTLDLNGHTISNTAQSAHSALIHVSGATLTVMDSSSLKNGKITSAAKDTVYIIGNSTFVLNSGTIENTGTGGDAVHLCDYTTATLNGGSIVTTASNSQKSAVCYEDNTNVTLRDTNITAASRYGIYKEGTTATFTIDKSVGSDDSTISGGTDSIWAAGITIAENTQVIYEYNENQVILERGDRLPVISSTATLRHVYNITLPESVIGGNVTASQTEGILKNTGVTLSFTPNTGYRFVSAKYTPDGGNSVNIVPSDLNNNTYALTMSAIDITVSDVVFVPITLTWSGNTVTASYDDNGTAVSITSGVTRVPVGAEVTLTIAAVNSAGKAFVPGYGSIYNMAGSYYSYTMPSSDPHIAYLSTKVPITSRNFTFTMPTYSAIVAPRFVGEPQPDIVAVAGVDVSQGMYYKVTGNLNGYTLTTTDTTSDNYNVWCETDGNDIKLHLRNMPEGRYANYNFPAGAAALFANCDITVELTGSNEITAADNIGAYGGYVDGEVSFTGTGSLRTTGGNGVKAGGDVSGTGFSGTMIGGTLVAIGAEGGARATGAAIAHGTHFSSASQPNDRWYQYYTSTNETVLPSTATQSVNVPYQFNDDIYKAKSVRRHVA